MILAATDRRLPPIGSSSDRPVAVRVERLSKRFPVRRGWLATLRAPRARSYATAVDAVSFVARRGEIVGFLGANGAGKTTLLKMLSTLVEPDSGRAEVMGYDLRTQAAGVRRMLAPVAADERSLDWRLSAAENLRFFGSLHGLRGAGLRQRIEEVLAGVELVDTGGKMVGTFSSGMRQRLLIARALLSRAQVLLLDEPTRSLDPLAARAFRQFLRREIAEQRGCTVLLATHDPEEALELCDRVTVLHRGRLMAAGTPAELARDFGAERYRLWTRTPEHRALRTLLGRCAAAPTFAHDEPDDQWMVEFDLPEGCGSGADLLPSLIRAGAHVGRFEKVPLKLADLMERVTRQGEASAHA